MPSFCDGVHSGLEGVAANVGVCPGGVAREEAEEAGGQGVCEGDERGAAGGCHPVRGSGSRCGGNGVVVAELEVLGICLLVGLG